MSPPIHEKHTDREREDRFIDVFTKIAKHPVKYAKTAKLEPVDFKMRLGPDQRYTLAEFKCRDIPYGYRHLEGCVIDQIKTDAAIELCDQHDADFALFYLFNDGVLGYLKDVRAVFDQFTRHLERYRSERGDKEKYVYKFPYELFTKIQLEPDDSMFIRTGRRKPAGARKIETVSDIIKRAGWRHVGSHVYERIGSCKDRISKVGEHWYCYSFDGKRWLKDKVFKNSEAAFRRFENG